MNVLKVFISENPEKSRNCGRVREVIEETGIQIVESMKVCDVVIATGGDGTILHVAKKAAFFGKPVLGVNFGRVGFVASIEKNELGLIKNLLTENFSIDERMMLRVNVGGKDFFALNDVVIQKGLISKMVDIDVLTKNKIISKYRADGVIVSTPTGSTAYALSAGGAMIDPSLRCVMVTPVCQHMKFSCPIIFNARTVLNVKAYSRNDEKAFVCVDGENVASIDETVQVTIDVFNISAKLIKIKEKMFFEIFNDKMRCRV